MSAEEQKSGFNPWEMLHPRIEAKCKELFTHGHYPSAAHEAMKQVELALKDTLYVPRNYGRRLINQVFGSGTGVKLIVRFGEDYQEPAQDLFSGAFGYYRNYAAHNGEQIDRPLSYRIMVIASELLDLLGASTLSFTEIDGIKGLVEKGIFSSREAVIKLLSFVDGRFLPDDIIDGFSEDINLQGFLIEQVYALMDVGLLRYVSEEYIPRIDEYSIDKHVPPVTMGRFMVTPQGKSIIDESDEN